MKNGLKIIIIGIVLVVLLLVLKSFFNSKQYAPLPEQFLDDRATFGEVNQLFTEAMDLTKPPDNSGKPFDMSKEKEDQIRTKLAEGIKLSKKIDDSFLDYLNPELKNNYKNIYVKGNELFLEGLSSDTSNESSIGVAKQLEGNNLIGEWIKWWNLNKDSITNKAFAEK